MRTLYGDEEVYNEEVQFIKHASVYIHTSSRDPRDVEEKEKEVQPTREDVQLTSDFSRSSYTVYSIKGQYLDQLLGFLDVSRETFTRSPFGRSSVYLSRGYESLNRLLILPPLLHPKLR